MCAKYAVIGDHEMWLQYQDLIIRNALAEDAQQLAAWWNDGSIMAHAGFPNGIGKSVQDIADSLQKDSDVTQRRLIVQINRTPIGEMNYRTAGRGIAEIGINLCESSTQNRGLGKILLSMLISSLFSDMGYQKIRLDTDLRNTRAQHVYEQLGFTKLRVNENSWTDQLGEQRSSVDYELIPENFICFLD